MIYLVGTGAYSKESLHQLREAIQSQQLLGPVIFILSFALLQPLGFGSHGFILASAVIWPTHLAFTFSLIGATIAGIIAFWFARFVGYEWVQRRIPDKLKMFEQQLVEKEFQSILLMRLIFFTFAPMQLMFGVTRVRFNVYLMATILGISPLIFIEVWLGATVFDWIVG